jgi:hypothetical protein
MEPCSYSGGAGRRASGSFLVCSFAPPYWRAPRHLLRVPQVSSAGSRTTSGSRRATRPFGSRRRRPREPSAFSWRSTGSPSSRASRPRPARHSIPTARSTTSPTWMPGCGNLRAPECRWPSWSPTRPAGPSRTAGRRPRSPPAATVPTPPPSVRWQPPWLSGTRAHFQTPRMPDTGSPRCPTSRPGRSPI